MEQTIVKKEPSTGILLSPNEAEEYQKYKRAKYILEVNGKIAKGMIVPSETDGVTLARAAELAKKFALAAVRVTPDRVREAVALLGESGVKTDVLIGGTGQTLAKAKAYECKLAARLGAEEFTVVLNPTAVREERFSELKKELKRIKRRAGERLVKLYTEGKDLQKLFRLAKFAKEQNVGISCPWFLGVQRLRSEDKTGCFLEVRDVATTEEYRKTVGAGIERILPVAIETVREELLREAENAAFAVPVVKASEDLRAVEKSEETGLKKAENYRALLGEEKKEET